MEPSAGVVGIRVAAAVGGLYCGSCNYTCGQNHSNYLVQRHRSDPVPPGTSTTLT